MELPTLRSIQTDLDIIHAQTGLTSAQIRRLAAAQGLMAGGLLKKDISKAKLTRWLKQDFGLGSGHADTIYILLRGH